MILLQEITLRYAKVQLFDTKIVRVEIFGNRIIDRDEAQELYKTVGIIAKGSESLVMVVANQVAQFTKAAIEVATSEEGLRFSLADAVVVKSVTQKITANIYLKLNKPAKPSRIFNSEAEAEKWLQAVEQELVPVW